ncbi:MAG: hypothetical protein IPO77_18125 [Acidobacteria bacterium]|nr:hypothetical protein [Acidobacteriota bacterium]
MIDLLARYSWPGNVRELENTIEHAGAVCSDRLITVKDLPTRIVERAGLVARASFQSGITPGITLIDDRPSLAELERRYVQLVLSEADGNKSRAAEMLGIDRRTIYRYLESQDSTE